ncbi:PREDICTED: translationally-controlled tumor protein-like [Elephantulus edwardii]|uniref:translationally-controlled tumor protein-like n=1 Tax=Elephantulus edwardii TaxID=28737 RepID=UPI0003F0B7B7|nr:PREDICTED: translationally-controlled tumor protein-like [Elephantulus edwardii]
MLIYQDLFNYDEMFADIYKILEITDELCLNVEGKMVSRTEGNIDDSLTGGNASAKGTDCERDESTVITDVDIVMNHHLPETSFTKEAYKKYIKDILANFKNYQFFTGENMNPDGMCALLDCREDDETLYMIFFNDGLEMENVTNMALIWIHHLSVSYLAAAFHHTRI